MLGRGIDQIGPYPGKPELFERYTKSALDYVRLAEAANGSIGRPVVPEYIWGDGLTELRTRVPAFRLINLETAITTSGTPELKGINYRMNPDNIGFLTAAKIGVCTLANNHVMDWGTEGLLDTLDVLRRAGIGFAGAGRNMVEASSPFIADIPHGGRLIIFGFGTATSGIPSKWNAGRERPGVNLLSSDWTIAAAQIARSVAAVKKPGDIVLASIHWGGNWGYEVTNYERSVAHALIDDAGIDLIHGHSSHHPKPMEVYRNKLILYGCGDLINDYEGIRGYEEYRGELTMMYFVKLNAGNGDLEALEMAPFCIRKMRLKKATHDDAVWLGDSLNRHNFCTTTRIIVDCTSMLHLT